MPAEKLTEKCGVFASYHDEEAARTTSFGLFQLQHRGYDSTGIASTDGKEIYLLRHPGLVAQVYNDENIKTLKGDMAVGHNRYGTSGNKDGHLQPAHGGNEVVLAHNGNISNPRKLENFLEEVGIERSGLNDSEMMARSIGYFRDRGASLAESVRDSWHLFDGSFSAVAMDKSSLVAFRDEHGIRPLSLGRLNGGWVVSSETCAYGAIDADFFKQVDPGELVEFSSKGVMFHEVREKKPRSDVFELIYFARPDSIIDGQIVYQVRKNLGEKLFEEEDITADIVIPVPNSAEPSAIGYSQRSGVLYEKGLTKNQAIDRSFIKPTQRQRERQVNLKLNGTPGVLEGQKVVVIDDSIVRGTTAPRIVELLRRAGASEVHFRVASAPVKYPNFYGIDTASQDQLRASYMSTEEIRQYCGADSLRYLSYEGMIEAVGIPEQFLCTSDFTGDYPIDIGERRKELVYS